MDSSSTGGRLQPSPRAVFAQQFAALFDAAGNPTLRRVAAAAEARMRATRAAGQKGGVSIQRISDWKAGRNTPAKFETFLPVVLTLIDEARKSSGQVSPALLSVQEWQRLWTASNEWDPDADAASAVCPYLGLASYRPADAEVFFGRGRVTAELAERVRATIGSGGEGGMIMLVGASGAGKSSLLAAGLIPVLAVPADQWSVVAMTPGPDPVSSLLVAVAAQSDSEVDPETSLADALAAWGAGGRRLLLVDQFEELFTLCKDERRRKEFLAALEHLAIRGENEPTAVVLAVRADFYARCLDVPVLEDALKHRSYLLGPMRLDELAEAITRPAETAGYKLESGLEELIITELCGLGGGEDRQGYDPGALPLVSHVMEAVWQRREGARLTIDGYRAAGGVVGSVAATAEKAWNELTEFQQAVGKQVLLGLVTVGEDARDTRRKVTRAELLSRTVEAADAALDALASTRLVTLDSDAAYLTHEIVLDAWPRLRAWIDEDRVGYLERQRLHNDAADWVAADRDPALLYRGTRLSAVEEHVGKDAVGAIATEFLTAAQAERKKAVRRTAATKVTLAALAVVALVLAGVAFVQSGTAKVQRDNAIFAAIVAQADQLRERDPALSAQLVLAAHRLRPDDQEVRARILDTQSRPLAKSFSGHSGSVTATAFRSDRRVFATSGHDKMIRLWDTADPAHPKVLGQMASGETDDIDSLALSADGRFLAAARWFGGVRLWDVSDPARPTLFGEPLLPGGTVEFSSDSRTLVTSKFRASLTMWALDDPAHPKPQEVVLSGDNDANGSLSLSLSRSLAATINRDRETELWDISKPGAARNLGRVQEDSGGAVLSPNGRILAVAGTNGLSIQLWDVSDTAMPRRIGNPIPTGSFEVVTQAYVTVAFSPDSDLLAIGSGSGRSAKLSLLSISEPKQQVLISSWTAAEFANSIGFGAGGRLFTGGNDGLVRVWQLPDGMDDQQWSGGFGFDAAGNRMVLDTYGVTEVWSVADPSNASLLGRLRVENSFGRPNISPDGRTVLLLESDTGARLFDISDPAVPQLLANLPGEYFDFQSAVFSSDSQQLTILETIRRDRYMIPRLRVWDLSDRAHPRATGEPVEIPQESDLTSFPVSYIEQVPGRNLVAIPEAGGYVALWTIADPSRPQQVARIHVGHSGSRIRLAVNSTGTVLVSTADEQTIRVWDITEERSPVEIGSPLAGHAALVTSLAFSPDGKLLASTGLDSELRLWTFTDPHNPQPINYPLATSVPKAEWKLAFHPSGNFLLTGLQGIRWWNLNTQQVSDRICAATTPITDQQWRERVPELPYSPPCR
ncbi:AAA family ATPase [Nocardia sp. XZ_19_385]|uniref:AAA family ATPase n=1 Tax=Nocardia sp. XZ_19_385 TaxID=2769488 RepID=UPI00188FAAA1|nr:AAA family ATPase [Nocardia sp. XZ_19_385]